MNTNINTSSSGNSIKNGCSFSHNSKINNIKKYLINLDWLQFEGNCDDEKLPFQYHKLSDEKLFIEYNSSHNNPNYKYLFKCFYNGCHILDVYTSSLKERDNLKKVSIKISNEVLYFSERKTIIKFLLNKLQIKCTKLIKIAIALDSYKNDFPITGLCRRYLRNKTVQITNDNLSIVPKAFDKKRLEWNTYEIGTRKTQKFARIYNKSAELQSSDKNHITQYYERNNFSVNEITRFELELSSRHLNKYDLTLDNIFDEEVLSYILHEEVKDWLKFYYVKLDIQKKYKRKDTWLKHSKEIPFIDWTLIKQSSVSLSEKIYKNDAINSKRSISFSLKQMRNSYINNSATTLTYIDSIANEYNLDYYVFDKIEYIFSGFQMNKLNHLKRFYGSLIKKRPEYFKIRYYT